MLMEGLTDYYKANNLDSKFDWATLKENVTEHDPIGKIKYYYINFKPIITS